MELVTNQCQCSYNGLVLKQPRIFVRTSNRHFCLRVQSPHFCFPNVRSLKISAFKDSPVNEGSRPARVSQNYVKPSYKPNQNEETVFESPKAHEIPESAAVHRLFKQWVMTLFAQSSDDVSDKFLRGFGPEVETKAQVTKKNGIMKNLWCYFWSLHAILKINMLIFIPLYLTIKMVYGGEVSKEMTPLYMVGPLLVTLYIKMLQALCSLYMFSINQTVTVITNIPLCYKYVFHGQLKEDAKALVWQPLRGFNNLDYESKQGEFRVWLGEKYLDFIESVWPFYCRTIRLLKRAHFI